MEHPDFKGFQHIVHNFKPVGYGAWHNIINLRDKGKPTILETGDLWQTGRG
jgi:hypothetical protein